MQEAAGFNEAGPETPTATARGIASAPAKAFGRLTRRIVIAAVSQFSYIYQFVDAMPFTVQNAVPG
jgi:hypothetical protein